jgi:hypothetical protein
MVDVGYMVNQPPHRYQLFNFTQMKCLLWIWLEWHQFLSFDCDNILWKSKCKRFAIDCQTIVGSHRNDASNMPLFLECKYNKHEQIAIYKANFTNYVTEHPTYAPSARTQFHLCNLSWKPYYFQPPLLKYLPR